MPARKPYEVQNTAIGSLRCFRVFRVRTRHSRTDLPSSSLLTLLRSLCRWVGTAVIASASHFTDGNAFPSIAIHV